MTGAQLLQLVLLGAAAVLAFASAAPKVDGRLLNVGIGVAIVAFMVPPIATAAAS